MKKRTIQLTLLCSLLTFTLIGCKEDQPTALEEADAQESSIAKSSGSVSQSAKDERNANDERNILAAEALLGSNFVDAEALYKETLDSNPRNVEAMLGLTKTYEAQNRKEEAREALREIVTDHANWGTSLRSDPIVLVRFASLCDDTFRPEEAEVAYQEVFEFGKKSPGSRYPKVEADTLPNHHVKSAAHLVAGFEFVGYGDYDQARAMYRKATELSDTFALAHFYYACELQRNAELEFAKSEFERSVSLDPNNELLVAEVDRRLKEIGYALEGLNRSPG